MPSRSMSDPESRLPLCVIALGGNLGDVRSTFERALRLLQNGGFTVRRFASPVISAPVGMAPGTPDFLNSVVSGYWADTPHALLRLCQETEIACGRAADHAHYVSRTLDLDIILFGDLTLHDPDLVIPHPLASERDFVLTPLRSIEPALAEMLFTYKK